jgi:N,N'-diacetyllegionaminate synthase
MKNYSNFRINKDSFVSYKKIMIIAEIGSNHDNDLRKCKKLILEAKKVGCDAVKFQLFKADKLVSKKLNPKGFGILKKLELKESWIPIISKICKDNKILFICSPFYTEAVNLLLENKCDILKIASPEIKNIPLIRKAVKSELPIIISTGDTNNRIIKAAINNLKKNNFHKTAFLHCTSEYPCKIENANLLNLISLKKMIDPKISIGYSDHTTIIDSSLIAVSMGANIIEKHITLNKKSKGPDHFFALDIKELRLMVDKIRNFEKMTGNIEKKRLQDENTVFINSFSIKKILKGTQIKEEDIIYKRDYSKGIGYLDIKNIIGKKIYRTIKEDTKLKITMFK